jgi:F420-dependent oxidoreductase-like protein
MDLAVMVEGQNGLNWLRWQRIAQAVEDLGFAGLFRSDHFTNAGAPDIDSLECWVALTWLASHTRRIQFGPLVSPISFRDPVMLARMAAAVDDLSGGRLILGIGAGWQEREHNHYGYDLLPVVQRLARYREGVEVIHRLLRSTEPVSFTGEYYTLREAVLLPRPARMGRPPILLGGGKATLPLVARYAEEWNTAFRPAAEVAALNARLDELLSKQDRKPADVRRSFMTNLVVGRDETELHSRLDGHTAEELRARGIFVGTHHQIVDQIGRLGDAGVQRVMLQWMDLDDMDGLEALAKSVLPQLH